MKIVISLGGSMVNPGKINIEFLKEFKKIILNSKHNYYIVCGGGALAREYINSAKELGIKGVNLDELGIRATEINAEIVSKLLDVKRTKTIDEININDKIIVTNGLFPGVTTDFDSVVIASLVKADALVNISNVKGIYDKDPKKHQDARLLKKLKIEKLIELASEFELGSGANFVFDIAASKLISRTKTKLIFLKELSEFNKFLSKKEFTGSIIE